MQRAWYRVLLQADGFEAHCQQGQLRCLLHLLLPVQVGWTGTAADNVGAGRIMVIGAHGGRPRALTQANDKFPAFVSGGVFPALRGDVTPAWSPDGKRVAFASQSGPNGNFEVVTVGAADGKDRQRLTSMLHEQHLTVAWQPVFD